MTTESPTPPFTVVGQQQATEPDGQGGLHDVMHVTYETRSGVRARHTHPMANYTAQNVAAAITPVAQQIDSVSQLGTSQ